MNLAIPIPTHDSFIGNVAEVDVSGWVPGWTFDKRHFPLKFQSSIGSNRQRVSSKETPTRNECQQ
jgi:hypothetical protein